MDHDDEQDDTTLAGPPDSLEVALEALWADYQRRDAEHARRAVERLCARPDECECVGHKYARAR